MASIILPEESKFSLNIHKMLENIEFTICIIGNGNRYTTITCYPKKYQCLSVMFSIYKGKEEMLVLIEKIKNSITNTDNREDLGENDYSLIVRGELTTYQFTVSGYDDLIELKTDIVIHIFEQYLIWLDRYENCELPGVIPESKLGTWSCVPNEFVKDDYWEMMK